MALWCEYEEGTSETALLVRGIDKLECMTQAVEYEERSLCRTNLEEFMELRRTVKVPLQLEGWFDSLEEERKDIWSRGKLEIPVLFVLGTTAVAELKRTVLTLR